MTAAGDAATASRQVRARRIGLVSDTHFTAPDGVDVPDGVVEVLRGVDLIVHLGHISNPQALDRLEAVAPVLAVSTSLDDHLFGEAIAADVARGRIAHRTNVIDAGGLRIGMVHDLAADEPAIGLTDGGGLDFPDEPLEVVLRAKFGEPPERHRRHAGDPRRGGRDGRRRSGGPGDKGLESLTLRIMASAPAHLRLRLHRAGAGFDGEEVIGLGEHK